MTLGIDFDHTIVDTHAKPLIDGRYPPPIPGALEALRDYKRGGHYILIHSCNRKEWIEEWLHHFKAPFDAIWVGKPICDRYIDDLGRQFTSWDHSGDYLK